MVVSSPRRRVVGPVRPARARRVVRRVASCASPPRHRRIVASSAYTAILTHPLPGSSEAGEGGSEACGCEGAPGRCVLQRAAARHFSSEAPGPAATVRELGAAATVTAPNACAVVWSSRRRLVVAPSSGRRRLVPL